MIESAYLNRQCSFCETLENEIDPKTKKWMTMGIAYDILFEETMSLLKFKRNFNDLGMSPIKLRNIWQQMFLLLDTKDSGYCSCIPNNTNNFTHKPKKTSSTLYEAFFHQLAFFHHFLPRIVSTNKIIVVPIYHYKAIRAYFRKKKRPGIESFLKKCLFPEKLFSLIWIKSVKNNFWLGWLWPPPALLAYPSALVLKKVAFYWSKKPFSRKNIDLILFILNKQFLHFL